MRDREFLIWLHTRLEHVHHERPIVDYMHKLRSIIRNIPEDQDSPNLDIFNSMEQLEKSLKDSTYQPAKPPIGLPPRYIAEGLRLEEIVVAIMRYCNVYRPIPTEWVEEYNELSAKMMKREGIISNEQ